MDDALKSRVIAYGRPLTLEVQPVKKGTKKIFITTGIDSTSLFYDKSDGANSGASGYIALLTAIDALSNYFRNNPARKQEVKREIVIGLFNGEIKIVKEAIY